MNKINDGGPAFPLTGTQWNPDRDQHEVSPVDNGMTLRDYFAAKAMQAQLTAFWGLETHHGWKDDEIAREAYSIADAMLRARQS